MMLVCARLHHVADIQWGNKKYMGAAFADAFSESANKLANFLLKTIIFFFSQIAITSWTPRGKNLGHGWSRRIYP